MGEGVKLESKGCEEESYGENKQPSNGAYV
jgi:hypothetical protein